MPSTITGDEASKLKYQMRHNVANAASQNIMSLAHLYYPDNVDQRPIGRDRVKLGPEAGHGKW